MLSLLLKRALEIAAVSNRVAFVEALMHNAILGGQVRSCQNWIWMKTRKQR